MPKKFDPEFKARAVRMVQDHVAEYGSIKKTCEVVGARLGVGRETLRTWVTQAKVDAGQAEGLTTGEREEIRRLKAENRRLQEDVAILRAATTFFVGELDPRSQR